MQPVRLYNAQPVLTTLRRDIVSLLGGDNASGSLAWPV
jgi:hypothetical protein